MIPKRATTTSTILFADTVASTTLMTKLGDAAAAELLRRYARIARTAADRYGVSRWATAGDGFMAVFASTEQGLCCAAEIQREVTSYALANQQGSALVRIGLNAGDVVEEQHDIYGAAINAAERICKSADPGGVLVSRPVRDLAGSRSDLVFEPCGEYRLAGFDEPWSLYRVRWNADVTPAARLASALEGPTPFVGREGELDVIRRTLEAATASRGAVTILSGEPGVGKTRLAQEAVARAEDSGFTVLVGACHPGGAASAYEAFQEAVIPYIRGGPPREVRRALRGEAAWLGHLFPEARSKIAELPARPPLPPERERRLFVAASAAFVLNVSKDRPVLFVIEDLHWADEVTAMILEEICRRAPNERVAIVATYRDMDVEPAHPMSGLVADLYARRQATRVLVGCFDRDGVRRMLVALGRDEPPARIVETVHIETEGNPFLTEEVIKFFVSENKLFDDAGNWRREVSVADTDVPPGVDLVLRRRMQPLSAAARHVLTVAAVLGRRCRYDVLKAASGLTARTLAQAFDEAERAQIIRGETRDGALELGFIHELFRQTVYAELASVQRQRLHLEAARALAAVRARRPELSLGEIAVHYEGAGDAADPKTARFYLAAGGDEAMATGAFAQAARLYGLAAAIPASEPAEHRDLAFRVALAERSAGHLAEAASAFGRAAAESGAVADHVGVERACYAQSELFLWTGLHVQAERAAESGLAVSPSSRTDSRCRLLALTGTIKAMAGDQECSRRLTAEGLAIAEASSDAALRGGVLVHHGYQECVHARFVEGLEILERADDVLRGAGDLWTLCECLVHQLPPLGVLGLHERLERKLDELRVLAQRLGHPAIVMYAAATAALALLRGQLADAQRWAEQAVEAAGATARMLPVAAQILAEVRFLAGAYDQAEQLHVRALAAHREIGQPKDWYEGALCSLRWRAFHEGPAAGDAVASEVSALIAADEPLTRARCDALLTAAEAVALVGSSDLAQRLYPLVTPLAERKHVFGHVSFPLVSRMLAMLAATAGRSDLALDHYRVALEQARDLRSDKEFAETSYWYGRLVRDPHGPSDRALARELLTTAAVAYDRIGMRPYARKAQLAIEELH